jgi:hypothetical protein
MGSEYVVEHLGNLCLLRRGTYRNNGQLPDQSLLFQAPIRNQ